MLFLHSSDELYGADRILLELVAALPDGVEAEVWLPTDVVHPAAPLCAELQRRGIEYRHVALPVLRRAYRSPAQLYALVRRLLGTARELRRRREALVYCTTSAVFPGILAARLAGIDAVVGHVQEIWAGLDRRILTPLAWGADRLVTISPAVTAMLPRVLQARAVVVLNATPDPGPPRPLAGRSGPLRYLVASRWNGWKGHRTLLAAWDRAGCPGRLTVLGAMPASGEAVDVPALVERLADPASVEIIGEVTDISVHIEAADVVIMPSDEPEPFGLVAIEAFAAARPVIASDAGGLADIVTDGVDGWRFPPRDVAALTRLLADLTRADAGRAGENARDSYERRFTLERYRREWRAVVAPLLSEPA